MLLNIKGKDWRPDEKHSLIEKQIGEQDMCTKRMEIFLEIIGRFNQWIIFHDLPRLDTEGFRWASKSFMGQARAFGGGESLSP